MLTWSTACLDWEDRIVAGKSLVPIPPLFQESAERGLKVMRQLRIRDVAGQPTIAEGTRPWLTDFAGAVFGALDPESKERLITDFFLLVSKKNWKSGGAAGIMLTELINNWRHDNDFLVLAPTKEVADNSYGAAVGMIKTHERLKKLLHDQGNIKTITHRVTGARLRILSADSKVVAGKKAAGVLVDELWEFGKKADADKMLIEATGGRASRPEGFTIFLSTMSDEKPAGIFKQKLDYFRGVRDGRIDDPSSLGVLYEFPKKMIADGSYKNPKNFYVTNPNLGCSVREPFLVSEQKKAAEAGDAALALFESKHLNLELGISLRFGAWVGALYWLKAAEPDLTRESIIERSDVIVCGLDGGGLDDLFALAVLGRCAATKNWLLWVKCWAHSGVLERRKSEEPKLLDFEKDGELWVFDELGEEIDEAVGIVDEINKTGKFAGIGMDPMGVGAIVDALAEKAMTNENGLVHGISQGYELTKSIWTMERRLASGTLKHCGQAIASWAAGNAKSEPRGNAIIITKAVSGRAKIDPLMAALDAVALMSTNPAARSRPYADGRRLRVL